MSDLAVRSPEADSVYIDGLQRRIRKLESDLQDALAGKYEAEERLRSAQTGLRAVRRQLEPMFSAMKLLFGEMDAASVGAESSSPSGGPSARVAAVWESWKQKLGGKQAEFIQALLEHGEMTSVQLKVATHTGTSTVPQVIYKLNQLGLINKNGGKYSLKQI